MQGDNIPAEIMQKARECAASFVVQSNPLFDHAVLMIARALMARDKRAAVIARKAFSHGLPGGAAEVIAAAILTYGGRNAD